MVKFVSVVLLIFMPYFAFSGYKCYHWTDDDYEIINRGGWKVENERRRCVDHYNFVFAPDYNHFCDCWCCQPDTPSTQFYQFTQAPAEPECPGNLVYNGCHSACEPICGEEPPMFCTYQCVAGCGCPSGMYRSSKNSYTCYYPENCPATGDESIDAESSNEQEEALSENSISSILCKGMQCGVLCNISPFSQGVCDGDGFCVSQEMNPCAVHGCNGKKCGDDCLSGDIRGVCNADGECDFNVGSVIQSGQCGNQTLKSEGEDCGSCFCPPTYTAGKCGPGLECIHNERIPDLAGKCVSIESTGVPSSSSSCQDKKVWCRFADCSLNSVKRSCPKTCKNC